jgi:hypothetical protein
MHAETCGGKAFTACLMMMRGRLLRKLCKIINLEAGEDL